MEEYPYKKGSYVAGFLIIGEFNGERYVSTNFKVLDYKKKEPSTEYSLEAVNILKFPSNEPLLDFLSKEGDEWVTKTPQEKEVLKELKKGLSGIVMSEEKLRLLKIVKNADETRKL